MYYPRSLYKLFVYIVHSHWRSDILLGLLSVVGEKPHVVVVVVRNLSVQCHFYCVHAELKCMYYMYLLHWAELYTSIVY